MHLQFSLDFNGRTEEAIEFYIRAIGAENIFMMRFSESPDKSMMRSGMENKILHATFRIGSNDLMASDGVCSETQEPSFSGFSLALRVSTPEIAEQFFTSLSDGGQIQMPLVKTPFAALYGMVTDRFGITWKIILVSDGQE